MGGFNRLGIVSLSLVSLFFSILLSADPAIDLQKPSEQTKAALDEALKQTPDGLSDGDLYRSGQAILKAQIVQQKKAEEKVPYFAAINYLAAREYFMNHTCRVMLADGAKPKTIAVIDADLFKTKLTAHIEKMENGSYETFASSSGISRTYIDVSFVNFDEGDARFYGAVIEGMEFTKGQEHGIGFSGKAFTSIDTSTLFVSAQGSASGFYLRCDKN